MTEAQLVSRKNLIPSMCPSRRRSRPWQKLAGCEDGKIKKCYNYRMVFDEKAKSNYQWAILFFCLYLVIQCLWLLFPNFSALFFFGNEFEGFLYTRTWQQIVQVIGISFVLTLPLFLWQHFKKIISVYVGLFVLFNLDIFWNVYKEPRGDAAGLVVVPLIWVYFCVILLIFVALPFLIQKSFLLYGVRRMFAALLALSAIIVAIISTYTFVIQKQNLALLRQSIPQQYPTISSEKLSEAGKNCEITHFFTYVVDSSGKAGICLKDGSVYTSDAKPIFDIMKDRVIDFNNGRAQSYYKVSDNKYCLEPEFRQGEPEEIIKYMEEACKP